jgi:hypothetical protein
MTEITGAEKDDLLGLFSGRKWTGKQITWWWQHRTGSMGEMNMQDMPGTDEIIQQMLDSLPPEQQVLALSNEVLRGLPKEYLSSLSVDVQEAIRRRIGTKATP